jgi:hypothetical protein
MAIQASHNLSSAKEGIDMDKLMPISLESKAAIQTL